MYRIQDLTRKPSLTLQDFMYMHVHTVIATEWGRFVDFTKTLNSWCTDVPRGRTSKMHIRLIRIPVALMYVLTHCSHLDVCCYTLYKSCYLSLHTNSGAAVCGHELYWPWCLLLHMLVSLMSEWSHCKWRKPLYKILNICFTFKRVKYRCTVYHHCIYM